MNTRKSLLPLLAAVMPALAFTLHDLVFQLPDNQHEASLGFFLTAAGLLFVWALGGRLAARGARTVAGAILAGALNGVMSVVFLWVTFITLNNLFTDRMSYEPDRIRAFRASGYRTMRDYVNHGGLGPLPLLMGVAALSGMAGSLLEKTTENRTARA
jgi:hypothetical protein